MLREFDDKNHREKLLQQGLLHFVQFAVTTANIPTRLVAVRVIMYRFDMVSPLSRIRRKELSNG